MKSSVMASKWKAQSKDKLIAFHNKFFFTSNKGLTYARRFAGVFDSERMCLLLNQLRGHGNKFSCDCNKTMICCNREWLFQCVPVIKFFVAKHFFLKNLFQQQQKKIQIDLNFFVCCWNKFFLCNIFFLSNQFHEFMLTFQNKQEGAALNSLA